ncbi:MAG: ABC transporter permease [Chitinivibrionales bacterium]|nr:ABC transporter permease [Chitinivibrionales bacterium]
MKQKKKLLTALSLAADCILFCILYFITNWHWFPSLAATEVIMWLCRLTWLNTAMLMFILQRLMHMVPTLLVIVAVSFLLTYLAPGDIFSQFAMNPDIQKEDLENMRQDFGLNDPWYIQFFKYIWNALHGNFGFSQTFKAPVFALVSQRALNTLLLAIAAMCCAWVFSIPAGIIAATNQYKWKDQTISVFAFFGLSIPNFFNAFLLLYLVASTGNWLPIGGMRDVDYLSMNKWQQFVDLIRHMTIPTFVLAATVTASLTRVMRANMLEILNQQYITTARAKGLSEFKVVYKHGLRNAINPMITMLGFQIGALLGGSALVEQVVAWPGLGKMILAALMAQDIYLVTGSLIYGVTLLVIGNLIADILLAVVDPRIRMS